MRILGVDPGLRITGYGCIETHDPRGHAAPRSILASPTTLVEAGVIRLVTTTPAPPVADRLVELHTEFAALLARLKPDALAIESLFSHAAHPATAMLMGHARGVILLLAAQHGRPILELPPATVKKSLTGSGSAGKPQMQAAIQSRFNLPAPPKPPDVADALAIALAASARLHTLTPLDATRPPRRPPAPRPNPSASTRHAPPPPGMPR